MEKHYSVIKTTTAKLQDVLNAYMVLDGTEVVSIHCVGGRDWVIIGRDYSNITVSEDLPISEVAPITLETVNDYVSSLIVDSGNSDVSRILRNIKYMLKFLINQTTEGWVEEMRRRHALFYASEYVDWAGDRTPERFTHLIDPEIEWGDIRYGRYDVTRVPSGHSYVGWIEDRARSWILFLGEHGAPSLYYPRRDNMGGVIGSPINLSS